MILRWDAKEAGLEQEYADVSATDLFIELYQLEMGMRETLKRIAGNNKQALHFAGDGMLRGTFMDHQFGQWTAIGWNVERISDYVEVSAKDILYLRDADARLVSILWELFRRIPGTLVAEQSGEVRQPNVKRKRKTMNGKAVAKEIQLLQDVLGYVYSQSLEAKDEHELMIARSEHPPTEWERHCWIEPSLVWIYFVDKVEKELTRRIDDLKAIVA